MKSYLFLQKSETEIRLDKFLAASIPELSRGKIRSFVEQGSAYINSRRCKKNGRLLRSGDRIQFHLPKLNANAAKINIENKDVLFENDDLFVVNKPAKLPSQPTLDSSRHNLVYACKEYLAAQQNKKASDIYLGIHHRLDRDTSGVVVFTKRKAANKALANAFQQREIAKSYLCIVEGKFLEPKFTIKKAIAASKIRKGTFHCVEKGGKMAITEVEQIASREIEGRDYSLLKICLITGRTHQIRVHLAHLKCPVAGDEIYGRKSKVFSRQMLHAWQTKWVNFTWQASIPTEIQLAFPDVKL